ncbi:hypothetical protein ACFLQ3_00970 [Bacteroidota bacterium]
MDFTLKTYQKLLTALQNQGFTFQSFQEFLEKPVNKVIVLRHDVDKLPENSLLFAQIQHKLGIRGSYYFRIVPESFNAEIIEKIAELGHEIGCHYEDIDIASRIFKSNHQSPITSHQLAEKAIELFERHLEELRKYYPVKTICMHGSPLSKHDNKLLWKYYNYRDFGIVGEPYFDIDFSKVLYLTDTGRRWNGDRVSIRDKVKSKKTKVKSFKSTNDIIISSEKGELPDQIMFTFHPQRWTNSPYLWTKELVLQNVKNVVKYFLNKIRS